MTIAIEIGRANSVNLARGGEFNRLGETATTITRQNTDRSSIVVRHSNVTVSVLIVISYIKVKRPGSGRIERVRAKASEAVAQSNTCAVTQRMS